MESESLLERAASAADLSPLRPYWHPVAYSHEVGREKPLAVSLLDEPVVLFRDHDGDVHAFRDLCPHRGAKISLGTLRDGLLTCPYHGFRYDSEGRCRLVPSQPPDQQRIPSRLRLEPYAVAERYSIVWVALEEPRLPLPDIPQYEDPSFRTHPSPPETWDASAARWMENQLDITHFAHVHPGILGDPNDPVCEPYDLHDTPTGVYYEYDCKVQFDPSRWPTAENGGAIDVEPSHVRAELFLPFTVTFTAGAGGEGTWVLLATGLPMAANRVRFFQVHLSDFELPPDMADHLAHTIAEQDRSAVEHQHPEMLPVDLTEEVHLRVGDAISIAYRHRLRSMGLQYA